MIEVKTERKRHFGNYRIFYISDKNEKYAACIEVMDSTKELPNWVKLSGLITWPEFRRKGYATALLNAAYQFASDNKKNVYLYVETDNDNAIKLYEKCGFIKLMRQDVRKFNDSDDYFHFYIMIKDLNSNHQDLIKYLSEYENLSN